MIPAWLSWALPMSSDERIVAEAMRKNWTNLSNALRIGIPERQLVHIIVLELGDKARPIIIHRCRQRFYKLRTARENSELMSIMSVPQATLLEQYQKARKEGRL